MGGSTMLMDGVDRRRFIATAISAVTMAVEFESGRRAIACGVPKLKVGPVRRVGPEGVKHVQPSLAANPRDRSNLVVVASRFLGDSQARAGFHTEPVAYFTTDGGVNWASGEFDGDAVMRRATSCFGDARAVYSPDGTAFCAFDGSPTGDRLDFWVRRSDDGGRRWLGPTVVSNGRILDYVTLAADSVGDKPRLFAAVATYGDRPLVAKFRRSGYGCAILRSDDGARSFSAVNFLVPTTLHHDPVESPVFLPDGRLLVGFADYPAHPSDKEPRGHLAHSRTYVATSADGGVTFSTPTPIFETLFRDGIAQIAVDRSGGPYRGRVYAVGHSKTANPPGLRLHTSNDGTVWTPLDVPALGAGPIPFAAAAVSSQGVLGLAWIQGETGDPVRDDDTDWTSREHAWDLYVTASADGGATFTTSVSVLGTRYRTDAKLWRWPHGTEYITLAASPDGSFHLLWVDTRDGRGEIQTARIVVES
jgi:hypothetical protein